MQRLIYRVRRQETHTSITYRGTLPLLPSQIEEVRWLHQYIFEFVMRSVTAKMCVEPVEVRILPSTPLRSVSCPNLRSDSSEESSLDFDLSAS